MSKYFKTFLVTIITFSSSVSFAQTPLEFNNKLAYILDSVYKMGTAWGTKFGELNGSSKNFGELKPYRVNIDNYINDEIKELNTTKDVSGSENFRQTMISFLQFETELINKTFVPVEKLNASSDSTSVQKCFEYLIEESKKEGTYLDNVRSVQKEYAEKNNFEIQSAEGTNK